MKKERRSLFDMFFGKKKQSKVVEEQFKMFNSYDAEFTTVGNDIYDSNIARECIDTIATHCAKLVPKHIQNTISNHIHGDINYLLEYAPNPIMTKFDFIYRIVSLLYTDNNVFIFKQYNDSGMLIGLIPILATQYDLYETETGLPILQFRFINGQTYSLLYTDLIHIRRFYNRHDIFGENNKILNSPIETANTANEGLRNAIKLTNNLRGIIKHTNAMLKEKDIKASRDNFVKDFIEMGNGSGIAALDSKSDFQELNLKPITLDKDQLEQVNNNIFDYFRVSEKIVRSSFTPEEWNAFYESVIEPLAIQMSDAFTVNIFNKKAIKEGHRIVFTANRLQYASLQDKINLLKTAGQLGMLKKDEGREIIDFAPFGGEEGEKIIQSLNNIDSKIANNYQGGKNNGESN